MSQMAGEDAALSMLCPCIIIQFKASCFSEIAEKLGLLCQSRSGTTNVMVSKQYEHAVYVYVLGQGSLSC